MNEIKVIGVVGAGTMGSALAQKFSQEGFKVILADREFKFVEKGLNNIKSMLMDGVTKNVFTSDQVSAILKNLSGTVDLNELNNCDIVIEAIFEDFKAKSELFKTLSNIVRPDAIIATNTSSFSVTELSAFVKKPDRFIGLHYFYHAAKNRLLEIIPSSKTSKQTLEIAHRFSVLSGKDAIVCADAYGFVVNRFFVPWLNEAVRLYEENVAPIEVIERVCKDVFGIGMGPFELMNATGVPVAYHAEKTLEIFGNLYKVAKALEKQTEEKQLWTWDKQGVQDTNSTHPMVINEIKDRMLGLVFFVCSQILDEEICTPLEIDRGAKIGLKWKKGPVELLKKLGENEVIRLVVKTADLYKMNIPVHIGEKYWGYSTVKLNKNGSVAVITIDQPESMNALSEQTVKQLGEHFDEADKDSSIKSIIITGSGKAFVAGADINFFVKNIKKERICDIEFFTEFGQQVFDRIDKSKKTVIAIINGLALGGGLELALCADVILALPKAQMAFPETGIGIYPGLGGTQRSTKKIGNALSKYLILTGKMLTAEEALEIGLVDQNISTEEMFTILEGKKDFVTSSLKKKKLSQKWESISNFFDVNTLVNILDKKYSNSTLTKEEADKIVKTISYKAPIAIKLAYKLIDEAKGCPSEIKHLQEIFSTSDALLGLTSIGKKVEYQGK